MTELEWFAGDARGLAIYNNMKTLAHIWDDLVDKDCDCTEAEVNRAFEIALIELPMNTLYAQLQPALIPFWIIIVNAYVTANSYEKAKDKQGLEIGHNLRYAAGHMVAYIITVSAGPAHAKLVMPEVWKDIVAEPFSLYIKEHSDAEILG